MKIEDMIYEYQELNRKIIDALKLKACVGETTESRIAAALSLVYPDCKVESLFGYACEPSDVVEIVLKVPKE